MTEGSTIASVVSFDSNLEDLQIHKNVRHHWTKESLCPETTRLLPFILGRFAHMYTKVLSLSRHVLCMG